MIFLFTLAIGKYRVVTLEKEYNIEIQDWKMVFSDTRMLEYLTETLKNEILELTEKEDFEIYDVNRWDEMRSYLKKGYCGVVIYCDGEYIYSSIDEAEKIKGYLPIYHSIGETGSVSYYVGEKEKYLVKPVTFMDSDGELGVAYITGKTGVITGQVRKFLLEFMLVLVLLMMCTGAYLAFYLNKCVLIPIKNLKTATENIINGNLDAIATYDGTEEFEILYDSFEEMRIHLKQSIDSNMKKELESRELISNISHDLKTPITAIKGYVEGIMDGVADTDEKMDRYIRTIYNKANDMDRLIGELTMYSKIDMGAVPYQFVKINVADFFDDCIQELGTELESKNFSLNYINYTDNNTEVIADPEQIKRVINNIISNSLKYNNKENGNINIRIKDQKGYVHFEIEDNGKGVDSKELPYIFERFYRTDSSRNSKNGGSGIGLSIVKKIIEAHGGSIWAYSKKDAGLSIHFILKKADYVEEKKDENNSIETQKYKKYKKKGKNKKDGKKENINNRG